ncbi:TadE family protein [Chthonobacter rhizosphaerae]|uniref:TadE family protein n=1 Tax=Chthonobacter rhizosphaerae TaxID=2735553 RepID=UPI0015EEA05F|nr:TadE family protein [Chthonobacter rhizosphaerae]
MTAADSPFLNTEFWAVLARSRTFWMPDNAAALAGTAALAAMALGGAAVLLRSLPVRRQATADLAGDEAGSVTVLDLVLVTPIFVLFMLWVFQFAILAKNHLFTHYAAYQAARSARVYVCPAFPISVGEFLDRQFNIQACDDYAAQAKAETAARLALIPAAPYRDVRCYSGCRYPEAAIRAMAEATGLTNRMRPLSRQARYMFDRANVKVAVRRAQMARFAALRRTPHVPVIATVETRFLLLELGGWLFADGRRKDGNYYTISRAEVQLL